MSIDFSGLNAIFERMPMFLEYFIWFVVALICIYLTIHFSRKIFFEVKGLINLSKTAKTKQKKIEW